MPIQSGNQLLDYNLVTGWNVQNSEATAGNSGGPGTTPAGYAQAGVTPPASTTTGQTGSGTAISATGNIGPNGNGPSAPVLENPGYADSTQATLLGQITAPATTGFATGVQSPTGLACQVAVVMSGAGTISVAPLVPSTGVAGTYVVAATAAGAGTFVVTVPPAGFIKVSANLTSWTWVSQN